MGEGSLPLTKEQLENMILGYASFALREINASEKEEKAILKQLNDQIVNMDCVQIATYGFQLSVSPREKAKEQNYFKRCEDREKSLGALYPKLVKEWDIEGNGGYTAYDVLPGSRYMAHWRCKKGHRWQARVQSRVRRRGCPYCSGRLAIPGKTDFGTVDPGMKRHWHPELNGDLDPKTLTLKSRKEVWWICDCGNAWKSSIYNESMNLSHRCKTCKQKSKFAFPE